MTKQEFGGNWTHKKLEKLGRYLSAYTSIMSHQSFRFAYIDAFAGTGYLSKGTDESSLFPDLVDGEGAEYRAGSTKIALETTPEFTKYIFIEKDACRCDDLMRLKKKQSDGCRQNRDHPCRLQ